METIEQQSHIIESPEILTLNTKKYKTRVVSRAFYEDAYLDFFITYYLAIGFDEVYILKSDTDPKYNLPDYNLPSYLPEEWKQRVTIFNVENTGNGIIQTHYDKFKDDKVDWVLNVDCDEFLILDWCKYPGGINDYLSKYLDDVVGLGLVDKPEQVQQIKYRWLCITKMNNNWEKQENGILGYINEYPMEVYRYIKSFGATKHMVNKEDRNEKEGYINCHFYINKSIANELQKSKNEKINCKKYIWLIDNQHCKANNSNPRTFRKDKKACMDGFILHVNTRSIANALTKCLTTKLRDNKKIRDLNSFKYWVNNINLDDITKYKTDKEKYVKEIHNIKKMFNSYLNSKSFFPAKIRKLHSLLKGYLDEEGLIELVKSKCFGSKLLCNDNINVSGLKFVNLDLENEILEQLCKEKGINYEKCMSIMSIY